MELAIGKRNSNNCARQLEIHIDQNDNKESFSSARVQTNLGNNVTFNPTCSRSKLLAHRANKLILQIPRGVVNFQVPMYG